MTSSPEVTQTATEPPRTSNARWHTDRAVLAVSTLAVLSHTIDEVRIGEFVAVPAAVSTAALLFFWPRTSRRAGGVLALLLGVIWVAGAIPYHLLPLLQGAVDWQNVSGLQQLAGGVGVLVVSARALYRPAKRTRHNQ